MAYIGRDISNLSDRAVLDSITASATATYNLLLNSVAYVPSSAESLTVSLNGVIQKPQSSYTVSGSTIVFDSALTSSDSIDFILAERAITLTTVGSGSVGTSQLVDGNVTTAKIADSAVTNAKITDGTIANAKLANSSITLNGSAVSLGGSATVGGTNTPSFHVYASSGQTVTANAQTKVVFNTEVIDTDNAFATNTFTVPSGKGGKYLMYATVHNSNRSPSRYHVQIRQNNSEKLTLELGSTGLYAGTTVSGLVNASAGDTFDVYYYNNAASNMTIDGGISKMFFGGFKLL